MNTANTAKDITKAKPSMPSIRLVLLLAFIIFCAFYSSSQVLQAHWQFSLAELFSPSSQLDLDKLSAQMTVLPTTIVALLAGGVLGLVSIILQQLVKNNLASDTTLAVGSGAQIALLCATLLIPSIGIIGGFWIAFIGAMVSIGLVFFLAIPSKMNPYVLILSGLIINILLVAIASVLLIFNTEQSLNIMAWGGGSIMQSSWRASQILAGVSVLMLICLVPLLKPLNLISLDDSQAQRLGVSVTKIRAISLLLIAFVVATVVSEIGILSFIGLGAATLVNALQVRKLSLRLLLSFVFGSLLLLITSNVAILLTPISPVFIPAGALSGILGAPLIIWLIMRNKKQHIQHNEHAYVADSKPINWLAWLAGLAGLFICLQVFAPLYSMAEGVMWTITDNWILIQEHRLPRSLGAMATGVMLAVAGVLIQSLTRNPMASPEVLSISSGAALGVLLSFMLIPLLGIEINMGIMLIAGVLGAFAVLLCLLWLSKTVSSSSLLLVGIAISALMNGMLNIIQLSGDPRLKGILSWLSGTSYNLHPESVVILCVIAITLFLLSLLFVKPLQVFSIDDKLAANLGINSKLLQAIIMILVACLSATATLAVGPLSFIGLMVPHLAIHLGAVQLQKQLCLSAVLGAMVILIADWLGRYAIFPYEIPAGTLASIIGGVYFVYLMRRIKM